MLAITTVHGILMLYQEYGIASSLVLVWACIGIANS
jgi:hypothetical protein